MTDHADIIVGGGGPAGCVAAQRLAREGYRVCLVAAERRPAAIEGLSLRVVEAVHDLGCIAAEATIGPEVRREASWQGLQSEANREWLVDRPLFDLAFRRDAEAAGVDLHEARIGSVRRSEDGWIIGARDGRTWQAAYLIDARGRAGAGRRQRGPGTTALSQHYQGLAPTPRSAVASWRSGWAWFATAGDGLGVLQLAFASPLPKRAMLRAFWDQAIGEIEQARPWLSDAEPFGRLQVRHADASRALEVIEDGVIRIGDAALAMDPLSGHGVFEAVASAMAAVPVVRTLLERPTDADGARAFYRERIDRTFLRLARIGRDFYALERRWQDEPFWQARRRWPDQEPAHAGPGDAGAPVIATKPVVEDGFIVERQVIVTADHPRGVWQVNRVPIVDLLQQIRAGAPQCAEALAEHFGKSPAQIETALSWLRFRGLIDRDGDGAS